MIKCSDHYRTSSCRYGAVSFSAEDLNLNAHVEKKQQKLRTIF